MANGREGARQPVELTAPGGDSGLYVLELTAGRHRTAVPVMVQSRERAVMLVVVPTLTWTATAQVDEDDDGIPDHARRGHAGALAARARRRPAGGPAASASRRCSSSSTARRSATTSPATSTSRSRARPRASDRKAVLLAGSERWITRAYGRRLRRYVLEGGRLASFGVESMRRGVTIQRNRDKSAGRFVRPTQPSIQDPFGTRFEDVRSTGTAPSCR